MAPRWWLLRVELDDQLLLHRLVDVLAEGGVEDLHDEAGFAGLQPGRALAVERVHVAADGEHLPGRALEGDGVTLADPVARDGDPLAVDQDVAVADELAGLPPAGAPAGPEHHVVQPQLQHAEQVLAGDPGLAVGLLVEVPVLLLPQLCQVLRALPHAVAAVLAGRVGPAVPVGDRLGDGALQRVAPLALQEQLGPLPAAEPANRSGVSSHRSSSLRPGAASWGGSRCAGWE